MKNLAFSDKGCSFGVVSEQDIRKTEPLISRIYFDWSLWSPCVIVAWCFLWDNLAMCVWCYCRGSKTMSRNPFLDPTLQEILQVIKPTRADRDTRITVIDQLRDVLQSVECLRGDDSWCTFVLLPFFLLSSTALNHTSHGCDYDIGYESEILRAFSKVISAGIVAAE